MNGGMPITTLHEALTPEAQEEFAREHVIAETYGRILADYGIEPNF